LRSISFPFVVFPMVASKTAGDLMRDVHVRPVKHSIALEAYYSTAENYLRQARGCSSCPKLSTGEVTLPPPALRFLSARSCPGEGVPR
jgi:hypothetical protein